MVNRRRLADDRQKFLVGWRSAELRGCRRPVLFWHQGQPCSHHVGQWRTTYIPFTAATAEGCAGVPTPRCMFDSSAPSTSTWGGTPPMNGPTTSSNGVIVWSHKPICIAGAMRVSCVWPAFACLANPSWDQVGMLWLQLSTCQAAEETPQCNLGPAPHSA
jgi:hypothetical protein